MRSARRQGEVACDAQANQPAGPATRCGWRRTLRTALITIAATAVAGASGGYLSGVVRVAVAYKAKILCSGVFVSQRSAADVIGTDLSFDHHRWLTGIPVSVDLARGEVSAGWVRPLQGVAVFRPGKGCTLTYPAVGRPVIADTLVPAHRVTAAPPSVDDGLLPTAFHSGLAADLRALLPPAFDDASRTRAIVIVHRGRIVGERYAPGFGPETPLAGWSMAKTALNALVGVLVQSGRLAVSDAAAVPEWADASDPRRHITVGQLLRMTSGLQFSETYRDPLEDILQMLFLRADSAGFAASRSLDAKPGSRWQYSGGTSNILARLVVTRLDPSEPTAVPRVWLFEPLGMRTALLERDAAGNFVASSFMYASARDWSRLGLLFLNDGVWQGRRLLPEAWVSYSRTPTPQSPDGEFGAHLWLRVPRYYQAPDGPVALPSDTFHAIGYEGQSVSVIPSRELVVVRLGLTRHAHTWLHDRFLAGVVAAADRWREP